MPNNANVDSAAERFLKQEGAASFSEFQLVNIDGDHISLQHGAEAKIYAIASDIYHDIEEAANSGAVYYNGDKITTGFELDGVIMGSTITADAIGIPVKLYIRFI